MASSTSLVSSSRRREDCPRHFVITLGQGKFEFPTKEQIQAVTDFVLNSLKGEIIFGDLISLQECGTYRNDGLLIWDGEKAEELWTVADEYGHLPAKYRVFQPHPATGKIINPYYWLNGTEAEKERNIEHNTYVWIDYSAQREELKKNLVYSIPESKDTNVKVPTEEELRLPGDRPVPSWNTHCEIDGKTVYFIADTEGPDSVDEEKENLKAFLEHSSLLPLWAEPPCGYSVHKPSEYFYVFGDILPEDFDADRYVERNAHEECDHSGCHNDEDPEAEDENLCEDHSGDPCEGDDSHEDCTEDHCFMDDQ